MKPGRPSSSAWLVRCSASNGRRRMSADKFSKPQEPAMQIGEQQEEFEILPTEEEQPLLPPEPEPQRQPEDTPA